MKSSKKLELTQLKVNSFVTECTTLETDNVKGGTWAGCTSPSNCEACPETPPPTYNSAPFRTIYCCGSEPGPEL